MCRRISQHYTWREVDELYGLADARVIEPRYNISPGNMVDAVAVSATENTLISMRWGFIPPWWRRTATQVPSNYFNAPVENAAKNPIFRSGFKRNRCIIPVSGYFEWKETPNGRQPYFIGAADGGVLSIAGMWDAWTEVDSENVVSSCTMIVTNARGFRREVRGKKPVLLDDADFAPWLSGTASPELLKPVPAGRLRVWPVSKRVNRADVPNDPTLIDETAA